METDPAESRAERRACRYPGCSRPAQLAEGRGAPPRYCDLPEHNRCNTYKQPWRLLADLQPPALEPDTDPHELLGYISQLRRELSTVTAELELERHRRQQAQQHLLDHGPDTRA